MKQVSAILFGLLLVWAQLTAAPASATPGQPARACCDCGGKMSCCAPAPSDTQPAPAIPSSAGPKSQLSLPVPASWVWALPEDEPGLITSVSPLPPRLKNAPLYARDCARLI